MILVNYISDVSGCMEDVYLLLGSNLGDRKQYISEAVRRIAEQIGNVLNQSSLYETASWGRTDQPDFINQAIRVQTSLSAVQVLNRALAIEAELGRERAEKWGARVIDIDLLFFGDSVIRKPELTIPHPHLHERAFVLIPMSEIAGQLMHPILNQTIIELCNNLTDHSSVRVI